ncbi:MAG TPA: hypothetical protein VL068_02810 [Microthrixaceae bacterium]|nr:hypothetical protein [Microthrixaceae bacterium]
MAVWNLKVAPKLRRSGVRLDQWLAIDPDLPVFDAYVFPGQPYEALDHANAKFAGIHHEDRAPAEDLVLTGSNGPDELAVI